MEDTENVKRSNEGYGKSQLVTVLVLQPQMDLCVRFEAGVG